MNFLNILSSRLYHVYKLSHTPSSQLADVLCRNLIYNCDGIVVINKPYGISFASEKSQYENDVCLGTILPHLERALGYPKLYSVKVPEKYVSGVAILSAEKETVDNVKNKLKQTKLLGAIPDTYQAVVVGRPSKKTGEYKGGLVLKINEANKSMKKASLVTDYSNNQMKKGNVSLVRLRHATLQESNWAALVEVSSSKNKWHCVRNYLSSKLLSPVLGDNIFGSLVQNVLGSPVLVDSFSPVANSPQKLNPDLQRKLGIVGQKGIAVPLHLHLSKVFICNYKKKDEHLMFEAPVPDVFKWTCEQLELSC